MYILPNRCRCQARTLHLYLHVCKRVQHKSCTWPCTVRLHVRGSQRWRVSEYQSTRMNSLFGVRLFRPWIKVRIAKPPSSGLHDKPPKDPPAPGQDEADETSTKQATTRLRAARRTKSRKRLPAQPEIGEKLPASNPKAWSAELRAMQSERSKRMWAQPGNREKLAAAFREALSSPESKALRSEISKRRWAQPGYREKLAAIRKAWSPERRAMISEKAKRTRAQPEFRENHSAALRAVFSAPGYRTRHSEMMKRLWERPEHREKFSAAAREYWSPERRAACSRIERNCPAKQAVLKARSEMSAARMKKLWFNMPEKKAILSARSIAYWKDP